jgi:hypothetical protein
MKGALLFALISSAAWAQSPPIITQTGEQDPIVPGSLIIINGTGLTGTTMVTFGKSTDGLFKVVGDTEVDLTVPVDAPPGGVVTVTTPLGSAAAPAPLSAIPYPATKGPLCLPTTSNFHTIQNPSTGNTIVSLWCDLPTGTYHYGLSGNTTNWMEAECLTNVPPFSLNVNWFTQAWAACVDHQMSASDQAYAWRLEYIWVPRPTVNGTGQMAVVTATTGSQISIAGVPQTIAGGTVVNGLRIPGNQPTSRYCDVSGFTSTQGTVLPAGSYAACTLVYAPTLGFQFPASLNLHAIQAPTDAFLVDASHNLWGIDSKGIITVNGIEDSTSAGVIELAYVSGLIWQENANLLWWSKTSPAAAWLPAGGTATAPL